MRVLLLTPDLTYSGATTQLLLAANELSRQGLVVRVGVLARGGPAGERLHQWGVAVEVLGGRRTAAPGWWLNLRRLLETWQPEVVHVWRPAALWALALATAGRRRSRWMVSGVLSARWPAGGWGRRWLLRQADCILVRTRAEYQQGLAWGLPASRLRLIPPGVALAGPPAASAPGKRWLLGIGPLEAHKGFRDAVWALDVLRRLHPDLELVLVGDGSERERLQRFVSAIALTAVVHFVGFQPALDTWLRQAVLVWVPSRRSAGVQAALEALAAGVPVVASRVPALQEVLIDGRTGFLVPPGDILALARRSRWVLEQEEVRIACGQAGQEHVRTHYAASTWGQRLAALYCELAA
jgi:glycosyltransferase involved in cell wall biosynthesis